MVLRETIGEAESNGGLSCEVWQRVNTDDCNKWIMNKTLSYCCTLGWYSLLIVLHMDMLGDEIIRYGFMRTGGRDTKMTMVKCCVFMCGQDADWDIDLLCSESIIVRRHDMVLCKSRGMQGYDV